MYRTHVTTLIDTVSRQPDLPALKIPHYADGGLFDGWATVTFREFLTDVEKAARYWKSQLEPLGIKQRDVVGVWLKGMAYDDAVHIWGLSRVGYIPQLFSLRLTSAAVISTLLKITGGKAVVVEPSWREALKVEQPALPAGDFRAADVDHVSLPPVFAPANEDDTVMIYHTSGSTSGMPKPIPIGAKWLEFAIEKNQLLFSDYSASKEKARKQSVMTLNGSFCHLAATFLMVGCHQHGGCVMLPKGMPCTSDELKLMYKDYGLSNLFMFSSFLGGMIREARTDPELLNVFQNLLSVMYGGLPLEPEEADWARSQGVRLQEGFGSTEVGMALMSGLGGSGPDAAFLRAIPYTTYKFVPISAEHSDGEKLLELIVPAESHDCPHRSFRDKETGDFHTGDLFVEVRPGCYLSRGRNDDWVKMASSLRCDTRSIEDNIMESCAQDLIDGAVVVGSGRASPAVLVERKGEANGDDDEDLKKEILRRISPFHERRYVHERIEDTRLIIVVPSASLHRTAKGSVQRKVEEKAFKETLDQIYAGI